MRTLPFGLALLLSTTSAAAADADPPAKRVPFPNAGISVVMHGRAKLENTSTRVPPNQRLSTSFRGDARREVATFMPVTLKPSEYEAAVDMVVDSHREGGLRGLKKTTVLGRPARDFLTEIGKFEIWMRVLVVPGGIVQLHLAGPKGSVSEQDAQAYFATLRPLEGKK